jgi:hypothetical protein
MASAHGLVGPVSWTHFWGEMSDDDVAAYLDHHLGNLLRAKADGTRLIGLMFHSQAKPPNAKQRKMMADAIGEHAEYLGDHLPWFIYAFDSMVARGAVTAVSWLVKKPFGERVHKSAHAALDDVKSLFPDAEPDAVWADIRAKVPEDVLFPWD